MRNVRTAVFVLIFANLVFMAWAHWIDVPVEPPVNPVDAKLPRLALAREAPTPGATASKGAKAAEPQTASSPSEASAASTTPAARHCVSVGPFNDLPQETHAASLLQERGFTPQQRTEDGDVRDGYWVYVAGIKSAADETRVLRTLQEAGISDAHAVPSADDGRRVSVGLFTERPRAERRARVVEHLGFSPDIVDRRRPGTLYWLDLDLGTSEAAVPTDGLVPADQGGLRVQVRACP
jgi:cell division septation protein DedD